MKRTVLIIDDEYDLCLLLKAFFERNKYNVVLAHTLKEGINTLVEKKPEILFLDNNLPDGIGWDYAPNIADDYPNIDMYLISAYHPPLPNMPEMFNFKVMEKPISFSDLEKTFA